MTVAVHSMKWIWEFHNIWETKRTGRLVPNTDMFLCKLSPGPVLKDRLLQTDASSLRLREIGFFGVMVEIEGGRRTHLRKECATLAYRDRFPTLPLQRLYLYVHTPTLRCIWPLEVDESLESEKIGVRNSELSIFVEAVAVAPMTLGRGEIARAEYPEEPL